MVHFMMPQSERLCAAFDNFVLWANTLPSDDFLVLGILMKA